MKELKFRKVGKEFKESVDRTDGIKFRSFYTLSEIRGIVKDMKQYDEKVLRYFSKLVSTAKLCTNIDFTGIEDEEIYDICSELKLVEDFECIIPEFFKLEEIARDDSVKVLKDFLDTVNKKIDKFDVKDMIGGFEKIKDLIKDSAKEESTKDAK